MPVTEIITIFKNFPKKHIVTLLLGFLLLISLSVLGSIDFSDEKKIPELTKPLKLKSLSENYKIEVPFLEKETVIKRNDSLVTILNKFGVTKENIIQLINSKDSDLLSKIEVGDKIKIYLNNLGELEELIYLDNIKSGIKAKKEGDLFLISRYESKIEKVQIFKHVVIKDSMYVSGLRENVPDSVLMDLAYINGCLLYTSDAADE